MKDILEILDEGILVTNTMGQICYCNATVLNQIGIEREMIQRQQVDLYLEWVEGKQYSGFLKRSTGQLINVSIKTIKKAWKNTKYIVYVIKEETSKKKLQLYEEILDSVIFPIWIKDEEQKYYFINEAFKQEINNLSCNAHHYSKAELVERIEEVLPLDIREQIEQEQHLSLQYYENNFAEVTHIDGTRRQEYIGRLLPSKSKLTPGFTIGIGHNITFYNKIKRQIIEEERRCYGQLEIQLDNEVLEKIWSNFKPLEDLQEESRKMLNADVAIMGIFTGDKKKCLISYSHEAQQIKKYSLEIEDKVVQSIQALEKMEWACSDKSQFEQIIWQLIIKHIEVKGLQYEIYPIKLIGDILGVVIIGLNHEKSKKLDLSYEMYHVNHQIHTLIRDIVFYNIIKEHLQQKKEVEEEFQSLLQVASDVIVMVDRNGIILKLYSIKKFWKQKLGWQEDKLIGHYYGEFIHPKDRGFYKELKHIGTFKRQTNNSRILAKDGEYIWCEFNVDYINNRQVYICAIKDISDEKQREIERKAYKQAKEIENIRTQFFANISHEFRTPLNIILSSVKLLEKYLITEQSSEKGSDWYVKKIENNAFRLLRICSNVIDLTKMDIGNETLRLSNQNIVSVVERVTLSTVPYANKRKIHIIFDTEEEEIILACDKQKIERSLLNLLSNALKFTPHNGLVEVKVWNRKDVVAITVKDTGVGIPKEKCNMIFESFIQVDTSLRRQCEGSGMGLAIAKQMVKLHEGDIQVHSKEGKGSVFIIELPIRLIGDGKIKEASYIDASDIIEQAKIEFSDIYYE